MPLNRPFVITADLSFRTPDVRKTAVAIEQLAVKHGGFVVSNQTSSHIKDSQQFEQSDGMLLIIDNYASSTNLIVRIPRANAQAFLHDIQPYITLLENQKFAAEDIATQLQRQILTAQREQQRSKDLQQLNQHTKTSQPNQRATLDAHYAAREQEDEAKIQQLELQDKIQFATIYLNFRQPEQMIKHTQPNPKAIAQAHRPNFFASVKVAMVNSWHHFVSIILFILGIWYVFLGIALFVFWRHKRAQRVRENHDFEVEEEWVANDDTPDENEDEPVVPRRRKKFNYQKNKEI